MKARIQTDPEVPAPFPLPKQILRVIFLFRNSSIQKLDLSNRTRLFLKLKASEFKKLSLIEIIKKIVKIYNASHDANNPKTREHPYQDFPYKFNSTYNFELKVFIQQIQGKTRAIRVLEEGSLKNQKLDPNANTTLLFFFYRFKPENEIFAVTSGKAYSVVRGCIDYKYPIQVGQKILDPNRIVEITRSHLVGSHLKETLINPAGHELIRTAALYYLVESFKCFVKNESSICALPSIQNAKNDIIIKIGKGLLRIKKKIPLEQYPEILNLFSQYVKGIKTFTTNDRLEVADPKFEFLHFLEPSYFLMGELDILLVKQVFDSYVKKQEQKVHFRPKFLDDYLNTSLACQIQYKPHGRYQKLADRPFHVEDILKLFKTNLPSTLETSDSLLEALQNTKLKFGQEGSSTSLMKCLEGEIRPQSGYVYVKVGEMWYRLTSDYQTLLQQDFKNMLNQALIAPDDKKAQLPLAWVGNVPTDAKVTQNDVKNELKLAKGIQAVMKSLKEAKVSYVNSGSIKQPKLIGEILKNPIVSRHKEIIEKEILSQKKLPEAEIIHTLFKDDAAVVLAELKKERSIFVENSSKERFVINPFVHTLKGKVNTKEFEQFLIDKCMANKGESEEDYNRSYLYDKINNGKCFGPDEGWLVLDQICPNNVEPCDIIRYTKDETLLFHVKEKLGQSTRDVCSQIINAAENIRSALSVNQELDYLKMLWNEVSAGQKEKRSKKSDFLKKVQNQALHLKEENFLKIFRNRKLVFVYALLEKESQQLHQEAKLVTYLSSQDLKSIKLIEDQTHDELFEALINEKYLDSRGRLTGLFYATTQPRFSIKGFNDQKDAILECLSQYKSKSQSTLAKLELIRLAQELRSLGFEFKICQIKRKKWSEDDSSSQAMQIEDFAMEEDEVELNDTLTEKNSRTEVATPIKKLEEGFYGFVTIHNSCYMNASLQLLSLIPDIKSQINLGKNTNPVLQCLDDVFNAQDTEENQRKALKALRKLIFSQKGPSILTNGLLGQQDAQEFMQFILNELKWFPFETNSHIETQDEEHDSQTEKANHISISLNKDIHTFQKTLNKFFENELMIADGYNVLPLDKKYDQWTKAIQILKPPSYLIIQIKRFEFDKTTGMRNKIDQSIQFPKNGFVEVPIGKNESYVYEIIGYINHHGTSIDGGHYTADVKDNDRWIHCDDNKVSEARPVNPGEQAYIVLLKSVDFS